VTPADTSPPRGIADLFLGYAKAGLMGFGGVAVHARRVIVEERRWLSERDYAEILGIGQVLPGPNVGNAAIIIGRRFHGLPGALAATAGLYAGPLLVLVALMFLWQRFVDEPRVAALLHGLACAAAGLVIGNVLRVAGRLKPPPELIAVGLGTVLAAAAFKVPLLLTVAVLGPVAVALVWRRTRRA
jgi:chromate transporter